MDELLSQGVNVIAFFKNGKVYGMTCAWATLCDYDSVLMLIGAQSETGNVLEVGDKVGLSALKKGQEKVAKNFGDNHSSSFDKLKMVSYTKDEDAILVLGAKSNMVCEVTNITRTKSSPEDHLVELKVLKSKTYPDGEFLTMSDMHNL